MKNIIIGITAHVDSGKTTLAEAMLYKTGSIRNLGRVDSGNSTLDTDPIERERGITIFSSQAELLYGDSHFTLLDTPGHIDFSAEAERTMSVLDYAVLVISGTDSVQSHTLTLWKLLRKYEVPVFIFVNKMDLIGTDKRHIIDELRMKLSVSCTDFSGERVEIEENAATCCEDLMEKYLSDGNISDGDISGAIAHRRIFPCFFGSALKMQGIDEFIEAIDRFSFSKDYPAAFGAKVYKISYDQKGTRLTHLKVTGGHLKIRDEVEYTDSKGEKISEKINSVRFYTGEKFRTADIVQAGEVCAVTGLTAAFTGQGLGEESDSDKPLLEAVKAAGSSGSPASYNME